MNTALEREVVFRDGPRIPRSVGSTILGHGARRVWISTVNIPAEGGKREFETATFDLPRSTSITTNSEGLPVIHTRPSQPLRITRHPGLRSVDQVRRRSPETAQRAHERAVAKAIGVFGIGDRTPDRVEPQEHVGVLLSSLTPESFVDILRIYDEVVGGHALPKPGHGPEGWLPNRLPSLIRQIEGTNHAEFRFGSRLTIDSKLRAFLRETRDDGKKVIELAFDDNIPYPTEGRKLEAQVLADEFRNATNEYLIGNGIGIQIPATTPQAKQN